MRDARKIGEWRRSAIQRDRAVGLFTVSLANNKSESWISDRTGHGSSAMINR